ncbi:SPFH domain / Band 7 family protein [Neomoorella glycerini]|uniref:SPFH domain / Band 7 family protein n=1 Tax=Neomoorella glycerini TaxID=55779 RepID=A0A6I5ZMQ8_9FIRM|nr:slipin family protein [Moorella glycerini]QGP90857.1 SPFH domain / Band 7 family protein [Moorella glycerini]
MAAIQNQEPWQPEPSRSATLIIPALFFVAVMLITILLTYPHPSLGQLAAGLVVAWLVTSSVHVVLEWERAVILRWGKFHRVAGPGLCFTIPIIDSLAVRIDQRMMATPFMAEQTLTMDAVPVNVDAVLFWMVWDPRKAAMEVENYAEAVSWAAQTALRDVIGRTTLATMLAEREKLDEDLRGIIDRKTEPWGVSVVSVEIRDVIIPQELQDAMSREAQAERERRARIILSGAEKEISDLFLQAAQTYKGDPLAIQLRAMNLIYESVKEKGSLILMPTSLVDCASALAQGSMTAQKKAEEGEPPEEKIN